MATKKVAKKVAAPKPAKVAKAVKKNKPLPLPTSQEGSWTPPVVLTSFSVTAIIPTQQYGNIQPTIAVTASSIEEARAFVMPVIEDLYRTYGETPLNGKELKFLGKVTETTRVITSAPNSAGTDTPVNVPQMAPVAPKTASGPTEEQIAQQAQSQPEAPVKPKSEAVAKAEKKISLAMSAEAAEFIQDQIENSVKIAPEDKPDLITLVLNKRNEFKGK